jgi:hypothetical protein
MRAVSNNANRKSGDGYKRIDHFEEILGITTEK